MHLAIIRFIGFWIDTYPLQDYSEPVDLKSLIDFS